MFIFTVVIKTTQPSQFHSLNKYKVLILNFMALRNIITFHQRDMYQCFKCNPHKFILCFYDCNLLMLPQVNYGAIINPLTATGFTEPQETGLNSPCVFVQSFFKV